MTEISPRSQSHWKIWLGVSALLILFLYLFAVATVDLWVEIYVFHHLLKGKADQGEFEVWRTAKVVLPPEALIAEPFSKELTLAASDFLRVYHDNQAQIDKVADLYLRTSTQKNAESTALEDSNFEPPLEELTTVEPFLNTFQTLVKQQDYEIEAVTKPSAGVEYTDPPFHDLIEGIQGLRRAAQIMTLKTIALTSQGHHGEALDAAEAIVRSSKAHPFSTEVSLVIGGALCKYGIDAWDYAVDRCDDPALLRKSLESQNLLAPQLKFSSPDMPPMISDNVGLLRAYKRLGVPVDIQNQTGEDLAFKVFQAEYDYLSKVILPTLEDDLVSKDRIKMKLQQLEMGGISDRPTPIPSRFNLVDRVKYDFAWAVLYAIGAPGVDRAVEMDRLHRCQFDLLRLTTARKIFTLEKGHPPDRLAVLVPDYLTRLPTDPFSPNHRPFGEKPFPYSIGPDGRDDRGEISYDPTNGTASAGDVRLLSTQRQREEGKK